MSILSSISNLFLGDKYSDALHLGIGYALKDYRREKLRDLYLFNKNRKGHTFVAGTTRVGKTRLLQNMIMQDIRAGRSVGLIDPKGDWEIWQAIVQEAYKTGREKELIFISAVYPQYSVPINPLSNFINRGEPISIVVSGVPNNEQFFYDVAKEITTLIVKTLLLQKRHEDKPSGELNIKEIYDLTGYSGIQKCREIAKSLLSIDKEAQGLVAFAERILESEKDYFSKVSTSLRTTLSQIVEGQIGGIIGSARDNVLVKRLENQERVILCAQTGAMLDSETSSIMSRILVSMFQELAGRLFAKTTVLETPFCLYMDEFASMVYLGIEHLFNKSGGANFYLTAATQSLADVEAAVGIERAKMISSNTNTKFFMRMTDLDTAEIMARHGGIKRKYSYIFGRGGNITTRETEEDIIKSEDFLALNEREFYYFGFEGRFFGKTAPTEPVELKISVDDPNANLLGANGLRLNGAS
ncbi:MAG: TraM recognition domain-containing protein [Helicobacteraceae bacterium]|jgi:type IV secretory pathway TraG/TraD family ATPase VirD4|nr:TraM recognition domain-containing protein [Helicobacteraceae bacterium]